MQYSTWKICTHIAESYGVKFSKEFMCTLGHLAFDQIGILAEDLELFSKYERFFFFFIYVFISISPI